MGFLQLLKKLFSNGADGDKTLRCMQCGKDFIFEAGERRFFQEKGFQEPKRCPRCRQQNKSGGRFRRRR